MAAFKGKGEHGWLQGSTGGCKNA